MANAVIKDKVVYLGSNYYKIIGGIRPQYFSAFPQKLITGDYDYANQQLLSAWITNDQRGGIGIEEMDESVDTDRCWFSELILGYRRHLTLPRLSTQLTTPTAVLAPTIANADMELDSDWTNGSQSSTQAHGLTYSWRSLNEASRQDLSGYTKGVEYVFKCWVWCADTTATIELDDGVTITASSAHSGGSSFEQLTVTKTISAFATQLRLNLKNTNAGTPGYFDDATITGTAVTVGSPVARENFNGDLYWAFGSYILKLNSGRTSFTIVANVGTTITALIAGPNSSLYIYLGDSDNYNFMDTSEDIFDTNVTGATLGVQWDQKLWKIAADGTFLFAATPNSATPSWTTGGNITDIKSGDIQRLFIGRDADGNNIIYASTTGPLKAHDNANSIWTDTSVKLPDHPNGGMGALTWLDAIYVSFGLDVLKYVPGRTAIVSPMGLSKDGGIPEEYNGEIIFFTEGNNFMFALVDASASSGSSKSSVFGWDGVGWEHIWSPPTTLIEDCEDAWDELVDADVTSTADATDFATGIGGKLVPSSAKLVVAAGAGAGDILATEVITSTDISQHNSVSLWVKSTVALDSGDLQLLLDDTVNCASPIEEMDIPAVTADIWTKVVLTLAAASSDTAIISVGMKMIVDKGAFTLNIDQIEAQTYNGSMSSAIVSSAQSGYALYFDHDSKNYSIDLYRGIRNPHKLPGTFTYASEGIHITPWFDAQTAVESKTAKRISFHAKGMSNTEDGVAYYRIDHDETSRDAGWTFLGTITVDGRTTYTFGTSGVGVAFQDIQFRFDLSRGSTNTDAPIIQAIVLEYLKLTKKLWGWTFTIDASEEYDNQTPQEQWDSLKTIVESTTLLEFTYRGDTDGTETKYVFAHPFTGLIQTGENWKGQWQISVVEP